MTTKNKLIRVFTGDAITALNIKAQLEDEGIESWSKNDFQSGVAAGIFIPNPDTLDVYIQANDLDLAKPILDTFISDDTTSFVD